MPDKSELAGRIRELRKKAGLNQDELADLIDVSITTVRRWEWGARSPRMEEIKRLASALHVTEAELLNGPELGTREFKLILDKEGVLDMNVVNISGNAPEEKTLVVTKDRLAVSTNLKTAGMDKDAAKKTLWEEFCAVFDDAWAQQQKWLETA